MFLKEISDLAGYYTVDEINLRKRRQSTKILIIDDEEFIFLESLRKLQFNIEYKSDIDSLSDVEAFDIVLSDIRGVGQKFNSDFGGAFIIQQIKKTYPDKIGIIYTANDYDSSFQEFFSIADYSIEKGSSIESWTELFDKAIQDLFDPISVWKRYVIRFVNNGMSTNKISKLESQYVASFLKKDNSLLNRYIKKSGFEKYKSILKSLIHVVQIILTLQEIE